MLNWVMLRLRALFRKARVEQELDEELQYHVAKDIERHIARGMSPEEARLAVRRGFGNVELFKEESRDARRTRLFDDFVQDVRYVIRTLRTSPGFTVAAVLTLALGIGLTTAIFSVVHRVLLQSLPFDEQDRLVRFHTVIAGEGGVDQDLSPPNFMSLQEEESDSFAEIVAYNGPGETTLVGVGEPQRLEATWVSAGFFQALQVRPILGRTFHRQENEPGHERVVVLSHMLWQQQFGGDPNVVDRTIVLEGISHTVIGVTPPGFEFPAESALWIPLPYADRWSATTTDGRYRNMWVPVVARLLPGVSVEAARVELRVLARRLEERFPETNAGVSFTAKSLHEELVGDVRTPLLLLFGAAGFVLFIACANVAGLLLARAVGRREEVAVRAALGAPKGRIVRQLVTESLVLGVGGSMLGVAIALWATDRLMTMWPEALPRLDAIRVDGTVLAFAFGVAIVASTLAGLWPAFRGTGEGLAGTIQSGGRSGLASQRGQRLRSALVVGELAVAVVLLVCAGLLLQSFVRLTAVDPGVRTERILSFWLDLPATPYDSSARVRAFYERFLERVGGAPSVRSAAAVFRLPVARSTFNSRFRVEGKTLPGEEEHIGVQVVSAGYFQTTGVPLDRGRGITTRDRAGSPPVVVINETAAKRFFPSEDPLGRRFVGFSYDPVENAANAFTIVGVAADVRTSGLGAELEPEAYFAHAQVPLGSMFVVVRATAGDPIALTSTIRRALKALDPNLPVPEFRTFEQVVADSISRPRFFATLLTLFSAVALILASVGIFGLLSFAVAQRTHEIGIRIALGASPRTLVETVVREASVLVVIGLAIGIGGALALSRLLESQLFGVSATDPVTFTIVALVLGATALMASLIPAWRAATVDPLVALRAE